MLGVGLRLPSPALLGGGALTGGVSFSGGYPIDVLTAEGAAVTFAHGIGALAASWKTGALFDLVVGSTTTTIHGVGAGYPDVKAIAAAIGIDPLTGIGGGYISKWYDQSGNGKDYTQATAANRPGLWLIFGKVYVAFNGILAASVGLTTPQWMQNAGAIANQSFTVMAAITSYSSTCGASVSDSRFSTVLGTGQGVGNSSFTQLDLIDKSAGGSGAPAAGGTAAVAEDAPHAIFAELTNLNLSDNPCLFVGAGDGTQSFILENSNLGTGGAFSAEASVATVLGNQVSTDMTGPFSGRMQGIIAIGTVLGAPQFDAWQSSFAAWAGITLAPAKHLNIVFDGASTTIGQGSDPAGGYLSTSGGGYSACEILKDRFGSRNITWRNIAISGSSITDCTARWTSGFGGAATYDASYDKNILIVGGESALLNIQQGQTGAQAYAAFQSYLTAVRAGRTWAEIVTILYDVSALGGEYANFNTLMFAGAAANGVTIVDKTQDTRIGSVPVYANPDTHPTVAGNFVLADGLAPVIQAAL